MPSNNATRWILVSCAALIALLLPAFINGFPFVFADTGGYLARPFERTLALGRSALYGLFLAGGIPFDFWPNFVVQAALTVWIIYIVLRVHGFGKALALAALVVGLAVLTSLPWYVGQLMPDVFLPLAVLALHLLSFARERLGTVEVTVLIAVVAFAMASHMSIVGVVAALLLVFFALALFGRRFDLSRPRLGLPLGAAAAGVALALLSNFAIAGKLAFTPGGSTFLFARLVQDGIVARYLDDHCPDPTIRLCAFRANLPDSADEWLWGDSPLRKLGWWEEFEPEGRRIIREALLRYPFLHIRTAARATAEQLVTLATGEGLGSKDNWHVESVLARLAPGTMAGFRTSRQQRDAFDFTLINWVHVPVALLATAMLPVFVVVLRRRNPPLSALALTVLVALLANAAICGIFSNPNARYQSRIAPLAVLTAIMALGSFRRIRAATYG